MMYDFKSIDQQAQAAWEKAQAFKAETGAPRPKFYILDMFPYPSGAGLHVGHPLGYIASDIVGRFKKMQGYEVLHPMGFDAFGLPAEQYAIQTNRHPADTTKENTDRYREQLKMLGLGYDWSREIQTSDPNYYKHTQWLFLQLFDHWYDQSRQKPQPIKNLIAHFEAKGSEGIQAAGGVEEPFTAEQWNRFTPEAQADILMKYRLAYQSEAWVNWCEALGTVLANDEVKDGKSERGGHPVERKQLKQWFLRISAYADRLLEDLNDLAWSEAMKEMQAHWIGKSEGAKLHFEVEGHDFSLEVFTTRPDTLNGVSYLAIAPEHERLHEIVRPEATDALVYAKEASNRSERERQANVHQVSGAFTGAYARHPLTGELVPIWIADYVLAGYGTGAVMAVPAHDSRDFRFAKHFKLPIKQVIVPTDSNAGLDEAWEAKEGTLINSEFLDGKSVKEAIPAMLDYLSKKNLGKREVLYRLRDANFSRQRYWGEPFPIAYRNGMAEPLSEADLPVELPKMDDFKPTGRPESPLTKAKTWVELPDGRTRETDTMPGFAGSSWYFLRFMDPHNQEHFAGEQALNYWQDVDLYVGGTEHAVGHLLYARFCHKFLYDLGKVPTKEPFKRLVNQGMILGRSNLLLRHAETGDFWSAGLVQDPESFHKLHIDIRWVENDQLSVERLLEMYPDKNSDQIHAENGMVRLLPEVEKMSKSKFNVVNPDDIVQQYGADTLRMYEMFLGPIEQSKPWNTQGIEGVHKFLKRLWKLCVSENGECLLNNQAPSKDALKSLHTLLKKLPEDLEQLSLNTCISAFMICLNELSNQKCQSLEIFKPLCLALSPFAPHTAEALWKIMGEEGLACQQSWPKHNDSYLVSDTHLYPVSFNGKKRYTLELPKTMSKEAVEQEALNHEEAARWLDGKAPKKVIVVPGKIVNIVV